MEKKKVAVPLVCHGHSRPVVDLFYSPVTPDGYFLISASKDTNPMLRNGETGDWIGTFQGHKDEVITLHLAKFIQFQLIVNVAVLIINFVAALTSGKMPLTTVQLLWVNLIMDTMGALALATDTPIDELMRRPPVGHTAPLISNTMWRNLLAQAAFQFQVAVLLALQYRGREIMGTGRRLTAPSSSTPSCCARSSTSSTRGRSRGGTYSPGCCGTGCSWGSLPSRSRCRCSWSSCSPGSPGHRGSHWRSGECVPPSPPVSWPIGWAVKFIPVPERTLH
ncbi:hypothetical protein PR202_ga15028 [Eleusine coracana subsp. coracana]|uniref:Cation-transporting P-type ATPase C-terminal domain-containing protein n=1 Tax=Eleusine coracana subsp. coracana TaxID=191504 RepID=A0AAV5CJ40_ELECO|nr:hypothetical protein PR202_ga15028 [Eleusine coracana subsp. coracana]